jgi:small subunit ribosomal protein S3
VGQKVHPKGFRIGIIRDWDSNWYADREYTELLHEDHKIRAHIKERFYMAGVSRIQIGRTGNKVRITIHTAKPGIIIGRGGNEVEQLKADLTKMTVAFGLA